MITQVHIDTVLLRCAHHILGLEMDPKAWLAIKSSTHLGLERDRTVQSLSAVGAGETERLLPSTDRSGTIAIGLSCQ